MTTTRAGARFDNRQFLGRVAVGLALALGALLVPAAGPNRFAIAALLVFVIAPAHFVIRWVAKVPNPTGPLETLAMLSGSLCAFVEPTLFTTVIVFQAMTIAASVSYQRVRWIASTSGAAIVSMTVVAVLREVEGAAPQLIVVGVFIPVMISGARRMRAGERRATSRMHAAVEGLPIMVWEADAATGNLVAVVGRLETLLGRRRAQVVDGGFVAHIHPDDRHLHWTGNEHRSVLGAPYRYLKPSGDIVWLRDQVSAEVNERGPIVRGVSIDVTASRAQEIQLLQHQEIVERMDASTLVVQAEGGERHRIIHAVDPIRLGIAGSVGRTFSEVFPDLAVDADVMAAITRPKSVERVGPLRLIDPSERFVELEVFPISEGATAVLISDVTQRELAARTIRRQAHYDELTGLPNRVTFMEMLTRRTQSGEPTAVLLIDLNRFKEVNDTLGHLSGDAFLQTLGERLGRLAEGHGCAVARLGGDEFAFVVDVDRDEHVGALAEEVLDVCRQPVEILGSAVASGASIGIALAPGDATTPEALLRCADLAMYRAKTTRRGVWWYESALDRRSDDIETLGRLAGAVRDNEFEMYFQPVVDLSTGKVVGAEALARWNHPRRGVLTPDAFLDLLSVAGLSGELTSTAIEQSVAALATIGRGFTISINLSAHDLRNTDLAEQFQSAFERYAVSPSSLLIEITEEHLLDPTGVVATTLRELADLGLQIAVDDFGTGYSSLTHLRSLPLAHLKIDREFVAGVIDEEHDAAIVRAVTDLAHNLGLRVTAEGVESVDVAEHLTALGCDFAQGYLWARPMPLAMLMESGLIASGLLGEARTAQPAAAAANPASRSAMMSSISSSPTLRRT